MSATSSQVDKALRRFVSPVLREEGFEKTHARAAWAWHPTVIWVYTVRAVGLYFSEVTGWPPGSLGVELGVHYTFMPKDREVPLDKKNSRTLPREYQCHLRLSLKRQLEQPEVSSLRSRAEMERRDLWWVDPAGSNAEAVALDVAASLNTLGFDWLRSASDLQTALAMVSAEKPSYSRHARAYWLAKKVGDDQQAKHFSSLASQEAERIGLGSQSYQTDVPYGVGT